MNYIIESQSSSLITVRFHDCKNFSFGNFRITINLSMDPDTQRQFEIRAVIKFLTLEGNNCKTIHQRLSNVYGESAPGYSTIARWASDFKRGRESLDDEHRSGRPVEAATPENIERIRQMIEENPRMKAHEMAVISGLSKGTVLKILHDNLHLSKVSARWIPHSLSRDQLLSRKEISLALLHMYQEDPEKFISRLITGDEVWIYLHDPYTKLESMDWRPVGSSAPLKVRQQRSIGKVMASIFWDMKGVLLCDFLEHGSTITGQYFSEVMANLHNAVRYKRPGKLALRPLLLIDNAPAHSSEIGRAAIRNAKFVQLDHPAYSPDLAPSDFFLFRDLKKYLRGQRFGTREELIAQTENWFDKRPSDYYESGLKMLPVRWNKCFVNNGAYFEKL